MKIKFSNPTTLLKGKTLVLNNCGGNIAHFFNDWYYSFFYDAITMGDDFDHLAITGLSRKSHRQPHLYFAIKCLPLHLQEKLIFYDRPYTNYDSLKEFYLTGSAPESSINFQQPFLPAAPCVDRNFSKKVNGKTLIPVAVKNFQQNHKDLYDRSSSRRIFIFNHDGSSGSHIGRDILNIDALVNSLRANDLEVKVASQDFWKSFSSIHEALSNFLSYDIFVGCYGAWLLNTIFCKKGSRIILTHAPKFYSHWWMEREAKWKDDWSIQHIHNTELGNNWTNLECKSNNVKDLSEVPPRQSKTSSLYINPNEVLKLSL